MLSLLFFLALDALLRPLAQTGSPLEAMLDHRVAAVDGVVEYVRFGTATEFSARDPYNPNPHAACLGRDLDDLRDAGYASYALPCGAKVIVFNPRTWRATLVRKVDAGPVRTKRKPHLRATDLDLTYLAARQVGLNGKEPVFWIPLE